MVNKFGRIIEASESTNDVRRAEVLAELERINGWNEPVPDTCNECGASLEEGNGYVGEAILHCPNGHGVKWEDCEDAIARVY
jgi:hypothetical protein